MDNVIRYSTLAIACLVAACAADDAVVNTAAAAPAVSSPVVSLSHHQVSTAFHDEKRKAVFAAEIPQF